MSWSKNLVFGQLPYSAGVLVVIEVYPCWLYETGVHDAVIAIHSDMQDGHFLGHIPEQS